MECDLKIIIGTGKVSGIIKKPDDVVLGRKDLDVVNAASVESALLGIGAPYGTVVVNTAAKINLEWCEANKHETERVNVQGALNVASACKTLGLRMVQISSGCIFDGGESGKVFNEEDNPTPACWYAQTKAAADKVLLSGDFNDMLIVRPRQLISPIPNPTNMLSKFISLGGGRFIESANSVTCIEDMGEMIDHLTQRKHSGIFNLANTGSLSPYEVACRLKDRLSPEMKVDRITYREYLEGLTVKRVNTLLSVEKLIKSGYVPRSASDALDWCIEKYGKVL